MKKREILLLSGAMVASLALGGLAMVSFRFGNQASLFGSRGDVKNYVLTLDSSNGALTNTGGYGSGEKTAKTLNGNPITIAYENGMAKADYFAQLKASSGLIYNSTAISGIVGITVNFELSSSGTNPTLTTGSSANPSGNSVTITSGTRVAVGDFNFFKIKANNKAVYIESIVIDYVCDGKYGAPVTEAAPSSLSTTGQTTHYFVGDEFSYDGTATVTYTDSNHETCIPVVDTSNIDMNTAGVYTVGLSYTVNGGTVSTSYDITVDEIPGTTYNLVTSTNQIAAGANYIIASTKSGSAQLVSTSVVTGNNAYWMQSVSQTISDNQIFSPEASPLPSFQLSGTAGAWKFGHSGQYLYDGGTYNNLNYSNTGSTWSISIGNNGATQIISSGGHYVFYDGDHNDWSSKAVANSVYLFTDYVPVELNLSKNATTVNAGHGDTVNVTAEEGAVVTASSSNPSIATASYSEGVVSITGVAHGSATISVTATKAGASVTKTIAVTVVEPAFSLSANTLRIVGSDKIDTTIQANATNFYGDVQFSASIPNQYQSLLSCTVDPSGLVTFTSGTVISEQAIPVTITATDGEAELNAQITVTVAPEAIKSVVVSGPTSVLTGNTINLTATVTVEGNLAKTVNWVSDNTSVATVNNNGTVTGVSVGTARITATSTVDGTKSGYLDVTVSDGEITSVSVTGSKSSIKEAETLKLTATVSKTGVISDAVNWSTSDADTATVSNSGLVTGVAPGSVTITATSVADPSKSGSFSLTVKSNSAATTEVTIAINNQSSNNTDISGSRIGDLTSGDVSVTLSTATGTKLFGTGDGRIRFGSGSGAGSLAITFGESHLIQGVKLNAESYGSDNSSIVISTGTGASNTIAANSASSGVFWENEDEETNTLTISGTGSSKRFYLSSITLILGGVEPTYPTSVSIDDANVAIGGSKKLTPTFGGNPNTKNLTWSISGDADFSIDQTGLVSLNAGATVGDTATVTVRAQSNAAGTAHVEDTATVTAVAQTKDAWTIMVYLCGSSLEDGDDYGEGDINVAGAGAATDDLKEMASVRSQLPDGYNIIVEAGGAAAWDSTYSSVITAEKKNRFHLDSTSGWTADAEKGEGKFDKVNMSDGASFEDFLEWGLENYPAEKTGVIMWDHGGAMRGCCNDNSVGIKMDDELLNSEVYAACETAFDHKGVSGKLEFIGYDCCLMQVQDVAEFNSHHFNYQVGSEELENGGGWPYDQWLPTLFGGASTETVLTKIVDKFIASYGGPNASGTNQDQTLSWLDLSMMSAYKTAWEAMALYLKDSVVNNDNKSSWISLIQGCKDYAGDDYKYYCVFDVKDFLNKAKANNTFYTGDMKTLLPAVETAFADLVGYSVAQKGAGNSNGLMMFYNAYNSKSKASTYYTASETNFDNWRSLMDTYYGS